MSYVKARFTNDDGSLKTINQLLDEDPNYQDFLDEMDKTQTLKGNENENRPIKAIKIP